MKITTGLLVGVGVLGMSAGVADASYRIFLNRDGGAYEKPTDVDTRHDPAANETAILPGAVDAAPWDVDEATWLETRDCLDQVFADFDVELVDSEPMSGAYAEVVITGSEPEDLGFGRSVSSASPFYCEMVDTPIDFVFPSIVGAEPQEVCSLIGYALGTSFGLETARSPDEIMSWMVSDQSKSFTDANLPCGDIQEAPCTCGRDSQNSYQYLMELLGPRGDVDPPPGGTPDDDRDDDGDPQDDPDPAADYGVAGGCATVGASRGTPPLVLLALFLTFAFLSRRGRRE